MDKVISIITNYKCEICEKSITIWNKEKVYGRYYCKEHKPFFRLQEIIIDNNKADLTFER